MKSGCKLLAHIVFIFHDIRQSRGEHWFKFTVHVYYNILPTSTVDQIGKNSLHAKEF